jgi:alanine-glyoxylate transaminase / serine-glyoxylate transaminase / serine-pyruvate transaminase
MLDNGFFAHKWTELATMLGFDVHAIATDWRRAVDPGLVAQALADDRDQRYRAVAIVHNETSTGVTSPVRDVRAAIDAARHPALLLVDAVSSLASIDYHHDEWGVDVTFTGSQKGLMLPPGLGFLAISEKAYNASETATMPVGYWDWRIALDAHDQDVFAYTPATSLLFGLREATDMLLEEGLTNVFARHARYGKATRVAVEHWGLDIVCTEPQHASNVVTTVQLPETCDPDALRYSVLARSNVVIGVGLGRLAATSFRIGHLGGLTDAMLLGAIAAVEAGLIACAVPHRRDGLHCALQSLTEDVARTPVV